jgi:hypothetical protein
LELRLRQAELTLDPLAAAQTAWQIHQSGRLPGDRLAWACRLWHGAEQPDRVVEAVEDWLRSRPSLPAGVAIQLEAAYADLGRGREAKRAATSGVEEEIPPGEAPRPAPPRPGMGGGFF